MREFRFGVSLRSVGGHEEWAAKCRRAESLGYDVITLLDHLGAPAPFPALAAAAAVTERVRVGTLVLNAAFYNPALLARDVATTIETTGGRLDLGLGAGHMKSEFDEAGLPWQPATRRIEVLDQTIGELTRRLDDLGVESPPLLVAGNSDGVLALAARYADIAGFAGLLQARGREPGTFTLATAVALHERVEFVRAKAGPKAQDMESNLLVQRVLVTEDPRADLGAWAAGAPQLDLGVDELLEAPQLLAGNIDTIIEQVLLRRERFGFSYLTVFEPDMESFAPVVRELAGR